MAREHSSVTVVRVAQRSSGLREVDRAGLYVEAALQRCEDCVMMHTNASNQSLQPTAGRSDV